MNCEKNEQEPKKRGLFYLIFRIILIAFVIWAIFMSFYVSLIHDTVKESFGRERKIGSPQYYWRDPMTGLVYVEKWGQLISSDKKKVPLGIEIRDW